MNRRGKRLALGVMAVGLAVVLVLAIAHWDTVRDHVEAWTFQLTRKTKTIEPGRGSGTRLEGEPGISCGMDGLSADPRVASSKEFLEFLATSANTPVVVAPGSRQSVIVWGIAEGSPRGSLHATADGPAQLLGILHEQAWRVLEQRFPRHAYVVIREDVVMHEDVPPWQGILLVPFSEERKPVETRLERALTSP
jgi:hypothetical protein